MDTPSSARTKLVSSKGRDKSHTRGLEGVTKSQLSLQDSSFQQSRAPPQALQKRCATFCTLMWFVRRYCIVFHCYVQPLLLCFRYDEWFWRFCIAETFRVRRRKDVKFRWPQCVSICATLRTFELIEGANVQCWNPEDDGLYGGCHLSLHNIPASLGRWM